MPAPKFESFKDFFPYYLAEHANPTCRKLHYIGTCLASSLLIISLWQQAWGFIPLFFIIGYGFAWTGHAFFERNKPATFDYPLWSFFGDYKMFWLAITGQLGEVLHQSIKKHGKDAHR